MVGFELTPLGQVKFFAKAEDVSLLPESTPVELISSSDVALLAASVPPELTSCSDVVLLPVSPDFGAEVGSDDGDRSVSGEIHPSSSGIVAGQTDSGISPSPIAKHEVSMRHIDWHEPPVHLQSAERQSKHVSSDTQMDGVSTSVLFSGGGNSSPSGQIVSPHPSGV